MKKEIKARVPGGMRDLLPKQYRQRQWIIDTVVGVYEDFGFVPIETPTIEFKETLIGESNDFNIFKIDSKTEGDPLALRFDLTVPLARVVCQYPDIPKPFKRYQLGHVFRGEKPQAGRFREFIQLDADIVGSSTPYADLEIVLIMNEVMKRLGIDNYKIRFNSRKILNALPEYANFDIEKQIEVMHILDKMDKIGEEEVFKLLCDRDETNLSTESCDKIKKFLGFSKINPKEILALLKSELAGIKIAEEGLKELEIIANGLIQMGVSSDKWVIDPSVARGLAYYTGPVFETFLTDFWSIGSVFSGGRYDNLTERFSNISLPATGASVGIDRLLTALIKLKKLPEFTQSSIKVLVAPLGVNFQSEGLRILGLLRNKNISCEMYLGSEFQLRDQLGYAVRKEINFVAIIGENEFQNGMVTIKNMADKTQKQIKVNEILNFVH